jgi:uncharacterized protein (DUF736 family)
MGKLFPPRAALCIAKPKSPPAAILRSAAAASGARSIAPGLSIAIEAAMGAVRNTGVYDMAIIGTFTANDNGSFTGIVETPTLKIKTVIRPVGKDGDKAPDFRLQSSAVEFGAAWRKTSREGRDYLSVKLDDPSFPAPVYATLVETDTQGQHNLIWSR